MTTTADLMARSAAVARIAVALAGRDAYVITAGPGALGPLGARLHGADFAWTAYVDNGAPRVLATGQGVLLGMVDVISPAVAVVIVPKTVAAERLGDVLDRDDLPGDGSRDVIVLCADQAAPIVYPLLFVEALDQVDPVAAAELRALQQPQPSWN